MDVSFLQYSRILVIIYIYIYNYVYTYIYNSFGSSIIVSHSSPSFPGRAETCPGEPKGGAFVQKAEGGASNDLAAQKMRCPKISPNPQVNHTFSQC